MLRLMAGYASVWLVWMPLRFFTKQKGMRGLSTVFKTVPTFAAAALAAYLCRTTENAPLSAWLILCGLLLGAAADAAIEYRLATGGFLFFCGHTLYVAALCLRCPPGLWSAAVFVAALAGAALGFGRRWARIARRGIKAGGAAYAVTLCALLAAALPQPFVLGGAQAWLGALGAALFVLSDALLYRNFTARAAGRKVRGWLALGCYYTAQTALALSVAAELAVTGRV